MTGQASRRMRVRATRQDDIAALAEVLAGQVSDAQLVARWQGLVAGHREMLTAELDGHVVGTVSLGGRGPREISGSLRLFALDVGPAFRRRGVGTALIEAIEDEAGKRGMGSVSLEVAVENRDAIRLYERLGYLRLGGSFVNRWTRLSVDGNAEKMVEPSWVMTKPL
jgi:ribosomal protein S18 acetylase RimI-like enzyme